MALRLEELAKTIDHAVLDPAATFADVDRVCGEARSRHLAAACVLPFAVERAAEALRACDVKVATVISYPYGADAMRTKVTAAEVAIGQGADELDLVLNVGALRSGDLRGVRDELVAVVRSVRVKSVNSGRGIVLVKAVVECALLDGKLRKLACKLVEDAGADFVVVTTGFGRDLPSLYDVELIRDSLPESIGVKAAGNIETLADAEALIAAGAGRLGTPHALAILGSFGKVGQAS